MHGLLGVLQIGHFIFAVHLNRLRQVATGNCLRQQARALQGLADGVHVENGERHHHQRGHCQSRNKHPADHSCYFLLVEHGLLDLLIQDDFQLRHLFVDDQKLGQRFLAHAIGSGRRLVTATLELNGDRLKPFCVRLQALDQFTHHGVVRVFLTFEKTISHLFGFRQILFPAGIGFLHLIGALILDDHVLLGHAHQREGTAQVRQVLHFGKRVVQEVIALLLDLPHPP